MKVIFFAALLFGLETLRERLDDAGLLTARCSKRARSLRLKAKYWRTEAFGLAAAFTPRFSAASVDQGGKASPLRESSSKSVNWVTQVFGSSTGLGLLYPDDFDQRAEIDCNYAYFVRIVRL
ncbi:hypothetical protein [Rhizobium mayense]|uniref:Uncharacterized protein n=1 Tax=Rhizobium mayense TaxID=1312184 RepID=A0ABT7K339_9HYPH|nr:hypothetical protein [Rhizobium mayense]MDL2403020.1 hypothetical protein [Rhizobium mayense]